MKYLRFIFFSFVFLILAITAESSQKASTTLVVKSKTVPFVEVKNDAAYQNKNLPLHGDVWFAFAAIGAISTYLAFKRK